MQGHCHRQWPLCAQLQHALYLRRLQWLPDQHVPVPREWQVREHAGRTVVYCGGLSPSGVLGNPCGSGQVQCWNGACAATAASCDLPNGCPAASPVRCANGNCASTPGACTAGASCATYTCANGDCVSNPSLCKASNGCPIATPVRCADGSCKRFRAFTASDDPTSYTYSMITQTCPAAIQCSAAEPYLCADNSCVASPSFCRPLLPCAKTSGSATTMCSDLTCVSGLPIQCYADNHNFCPPTRPLRCGSGACVARRSECPDRHPKSCPSSQVQCFDGSCRAGYFDCVSLAYAVQNVVR